MRNKISRLELRKLIMESMILKENRSKMKELSFKGPGTIEFERAPGKESGKKGVSKMMIGSASNAGRYYKVSKLIIKNKGINLKKLNVKPATFKSTKGSLITYEISGDFEVYGANKKLIDASNLNKEVLLYESELETILSTIAANTKTSIEEEIYDITSLKKVKFQGIKPRYVRVNNDKSLDFFGNPSDTGYKNPGFSGHEFKLIHNTPASDKVIPAWNDWFEKNQDKKITREKAVEIGLTFSRDPKKSATGISTAAYKVSSNVLATQGDEKTAFKNHIKDRVSGNKFRDWVNETFPEAAQAKKSKKIKILYPPDSSNAVEREVVGFDLDKGSPKASFKNSYIRNAWKQVGEFYLIHQILSDDDDEVKSAENNLGGKGSQNLEDFKKDKMKMMNRNEVGDKLKKSLEGAGDHPGGRSEKMGEGKIKHGLSRGSLYRQRYRRY